MAQEPSGSLMNALHQLYARVSRRLWRGRAQSYHQGVEQDADINPLLEARIDRMATASPGGQGQAGSPLDQGASFSAMPSSSEQVAFVAGGVLAGLSQQFKQVNGPSQLDREAGAKLKQSTWDHIHSALRLMRQGDKDNAQLHSRIANNALREAGHFLPAEDYRSFVAEVTEYLHNHPE